MANTPCSPNTFPFTDQAFLISHGVYKELIHVNKFGRNTDVGTSFETIWDGGGDYNYSSTADITDVVSSDSGDTFAIEVQGLDANWNLVTQSVTLTGTTSAELTTPLLRVFRMKNTSATAATGNIQCGVGSTTTSFTAGNLRAQITAGKEQTLMALYTVPANHTAYLTNIWGSTNRSQTTGAIDLELLARSPGGVFRVQNTTGLAAAGNNLFQHFYNPYPSYGEKTDLEFHGTASTGSFDTSAGFDLILHNNARGT